LRLPPGRWLSPLTARCGRERNLWSFTGSVATSDGSGRGSVGAGNNLLAVIFKLVRAAAREAPADSRKAVVVLTGGGVSDCGTPADCQANQDSLRQRSGSSGVSIVAVAVSPTPGAIDRRQLGTWAQSQRGSVFWAQDATQVPTIFGRIPEILDGRHGALDVTVQLNSPATGAFASGSTVVGTLEVEVCPWECRDVVQVPFALRVP
jgi:hypothetical protein